MKNLKNSLAGGVLFSALLSSAVALIRLKWVFYIPYRARWQFQKQR